MIVQELIFGVLGLQFDDLLDIQNINATCLPENYRLSVGVAFPYSYHGFGSVDCFRNSTHLMIADKLSRLLCCMCIPRIQNCARPPSLCS